MTAKDFYRVSDSVRFIMKQKAREEARKDLEDIERLAMAEYYSSPAFVSELSKTLG